ncbi:MAG TPA: LON peptidase substrate-binding domain-containing protein [Acidimicrobiia bacterium]|nr:LON peptidase substrate-binding domain-containing protein [Acidimicrobiia bacterium]
MPMFPLGTVLFPYVLLPLHVFEPRYRLMLRHVLDGDREFGVVLIERGSEVGGGDTRFDVGTVARIVQAAELPDGRYALSTVGLRRIGIRRWLADDPYPRAEVVYLEDSTGRNAVAERENAVAALARVVELARQIDTRVGAPPELADDPVRASYEAAAAAPIGAFDAQRLLATPDAATRLALLAGLLDDRAAELRARLDLDDGAG